MTELVRSVAVCAEENFCPDIPDVLFAIDACRKVANIAGAMALIRKLFWIAVFLISTLAFVVLFEKGTNNFPENFVKQAKDFREFAEGYLKPDASKGKDKKATP